MSRTRHKKDIDQDTRHSSRPRMTRHSYTYKRSRWERPANKGVPGAWLMFLNWGGYTRARMVRGERKLMKTYGRRRDRRKRNKGTGFIR